MDHVDVAVVGAGITGLRVAHHLVSAGRRVRVLEARNEVGGRLRTVDGVDLGASWFWPGESRIRALIDDLGVATHPQHRDGDALYQDPRGVQRLAGNPVDVASGRFSDGAADLARGLAARLPAEVIRTGIRVEAIRVVPRGDVPPLQTPRPGPVRVEWSGGGLTAGHVVLALPPALAMHALAFEPALPGDVARLAAAVPVWMANTTKVVARYAEPFWRRAGLAGAAVSHVGPLRELHDLSGPGGTRPALFGFAAPLDRWAPGDPRAAVVAQLVALFGAAAGAPRTIEMVDWSREPFTAPPGASGLHRHDLFGHPGLSAPLHGRIHLASTETAPAFAGHVEGALAAADAVAARLLDGGPVLPAPPRA